MVYDNKKTMEKNTMADITKIDKITVDIAKQERVIEKLENDIEVNKKSSMKLNHTDEWKTFEKTALLKKLVDEEMTFLDLRLQRMEMKLQK